MPKYYETPEFKALNSKWKNKLEKAGFKDIEQEDENLRVWTSSLFGLRPDWDKSKEEYFRAAGKFLWDHEFETRTEYRIWELHSQGVSITKIVKALRRYGILTHKNKVHETIKALVQVMVSKCQK